MPRISKKIIEKIIETQNLTTDILKKYGFDFVDSHPEEWSDFEKNIYELANDIEKGLQNRFLEILGIEPSNETD